MIYTGVIQRKNAIKITCCVDLKLVRINIKYKNEGRRQKSNIKKAIKYSWRWSKNWIDEMNVRENGEENG